MTINIKGYRLVTVAFAFALLTIVSGSLWRQHNDSPQRALQRFYDGEGVTGEDETMDSLILAGDKVVPLVVREIKDKKMAKRRYAIGFLGNGSYKQALPALASILRDETEIDYFRGDALQSIHLIDASQGREYARTYKQRSDYLGKIAREIIAGSFMLGWRRSYQDALTHRHD